MKAKKNPMKEEGLFFNEITAAWNDPEVMAKKAKEYGFKNVDELKSAYLTVRLHREEAYEEYFKHMPYKWNMNNGLIAILTNRLMGAGIITLTQLCATDNEVLDAIKGVGPAAMSIINQVKEYEDIYRALLRENVPAGSAKKLTILLNDSGFMTVSSVHAAGMDVIEKVLPKFGKKSREYVGKLCEG